MNYARIAAILPEEEKIITLIMLEKHTFSLTRQTQHKSLVL